jgi:hypothetical protein
MCSAVAAEEPPTPSRLATIDAVISFCREVAPAGDGAYKALQVSLIGKQSDRVLDVLENAPDYQQTIAFIWTVLDGSSRDALRRDCYAAIGGRDRGGER